MERPEITNKMIEEAVRTLAKENGYGWDDVQINDIVKCYEIHINGYELAKKLESLCYWAICSVDVYELDYVDDKVKDVHRAACLEWVKEYDIQPPFPVGTMTTKGEITGISEHNIASYLVRENEETSDHRLLVVRFEDAKVVRR